MNDENVIELSGCPNTCGKWSSLRPGGKEHHNCLSNWEELLTGITDPIIRMVTAVLLENQRLMNEVVTGKYINDEFREKSIPLVAKVFSNLKAWKLISIQPLLGPAGILYHMANARLEDGGIVGRIDTEDVCAKTRMLKTVVIKAGATIAEDMKDKAAYLGDVDVLAEKIVTELDNEFVTDLRNNVSTIGTLKANAEVGPITEERLRSAIHELGEVMKVKLHGLKPNWLLVDPQLLERYPGAFAKLWEPLSIYPHEGAGILLGYRGDAYFHSGYFYCPYIPFTLSPLREDGSYVILTRYGKKLLRDGAPHYGKVVIDG